MTNNCVTTFSDAPSLDTGLSLDDDQLDRVSTKNERDEDCLQEMLGEESMTSHPELHKSPIEDSAIVVQSEVSLMTDPELTQKGVSPCK